jgi:hypothetical protein
MYTLRLACVGAIFLLGGCAESTAYRADEVPDTPLAANERVQGRVLIYTSWTDDDRVITAGPTTVMGAGMTLTTPVGVMVREIALKVFSRAAAGGADESHDFANQRRYSIVLRPQIENFEYGFPYHKIGVKVAPDVRVLLRITLLDDTGNTILEKDYDSGNRTGDRKLINRALVEQTNALAHRVIYELMRRAAADVHSYQQTQELQTRPADATGS